MREVPDAEGFGKPKTNNNRLKDRYVIDNDQTSISSDTIYLKHIGYAAKGSEIFHGAVIHVNDYTKNNGNQDLVLTASGDGTSGGDIRIEAVVTEPRDPDNIKMYDGIQAYGERNVTLNASGDIFIYANNNGVDADDTKDNYGSGGKVTINALNGSNIIHGGINRQRSEPDKNGDGIRTEGTGSIYVYATETNTITGHDVGVYVHGDSEKTLSKDTTYNILVKADGTNLQNGGFANIILGYNLSSARFV